MKQSTHHSRYERDDESVPSTTTSQPRQTLLSPRQFSARNPAFSEPAVRNLIFKAGSRVSTGGSIPGNGLIESGALLRVGRKVLIDEDRFFAWVRLQNEAPK